ncbi:MAG: hypothetical protein A2747_01885 [Candidatus Yonathbacteria bacterium RIFCSPHIGHO2_01_FULL_44_41]|uniref:Uncharacterized protein n=1 Tax=Candidatus Yonathbacteria bacterium RIFCSPHIGHO2_02_FULL_44_14 TaxID=1802724 RepID=A0A1G2S924_9BACT|nr:MAG: hypothetical protein A2747_01885 [Candidatus Yonathbacteria bacterium RIFCSPHIGHO2_01_FULL_44_41]OHA81613.1 MAG: hypothetical protein A3D51_02460 [Candidatus Yonathbacteria bacterium RIFCSPHIGHO2_02_FULL_44_14]OHA81794.1 MAG: hypothetical protein A3B06_02395 [Candidatus Yonathbacteria bacterium RIFCSPLOWO2_01_FULL_43_20]
MKGFMRSLVNRLITKNRYDKLLEIQFPNNRDEFLRYVKEDLASDDVNTMTPETLGKIMCQIDNGDVSVTKEELSNFVQFLGNCDELLREMVSLCLACVIYKHLNGSLTSTQNTQESSLRIVKK